MGRRKTILSGMVTESSLLLREIVTQWPFPAKYLNKQHFKSYSVSSTPALESLAKGKDWPHIQLIQSLMD